KDSARANEVLGKGAATGDIAQMFDLAENYHNERKFAEARGMWAKIVVAEKGPLKKQGDLFRNKAAFELATAMLKGVGGPPDPVEGRKLLERVAIAGESETVEAGFLLGTMLAAGEFGAPDPAKAKFWYERAAKNGSANAMFALGMMHKTGAGIPQNPVEARKWIAAAANN
ncbi:unnamed protein product, partial [Phaeothamnion confervicola]